MNEEINHYLAIDYCATGEGRTIYLLIARSYTDPERVMKEKVGDYFGIGIENLTREIFFERYGHLVPEVVKQMSDKDSNAQPFNFHFFQEFHFNYS